ncbi:MAG TPA: hypothetical protein DIT89_01380 [Planctomycetaceae bacterium]|nr:hypothetical protein [Planctomycetaceae bacterium]
MTNRRRWNDAAEFFCRRLLARPVENAEAVPFEKKARNSMIHPSGHFKRCCDITPPALPTSADRSFER